MDHFAAAILLAVNLAWLCLTLLGLFGNWMMIVSVLLVLWWRWAPGAPLSEQMFHPATLIVLVVLAVVGELLEFLLSAAGARKAGGSRFGALMALIGSVAGGIIGTFAIPIPVVGTLLGACGGAFGGALIGELMLGRQMGDSLRSGEGAAVGRLLGTVGKLAVGLAMYLIIAFAAFWS